MPKYDIQTIVNDIASRLKALEELSAQHTKILAEIVPLLKKLTEEQDDGQTAD